MVAYDIWFVSFDYNLFKLWSGELVLIQSMIHYIDPAASDELTQFISGFHFSVNGFGLWKIRPEQLINRGFIADFQLLHIERGKLRVTVRGRDHFCLPGDFVLFEPFVIYTTEQLTPADLYCYKIRFDILPEFRKNVFFSALTDCGRVVFNAAELPSIEGIFEQLCFSAQQKQLGFVAELNAVLRLVLVHMLRARWMKKENAEGCDAWQKNRHNFSREVELVGKSVQYIQEHLDQHVRIFDISKNLCVSENYLYKCFIEVLQMPPSRYILQYKIRKSIEMMLALDITIEEVATELGFSSLHHFSKTFKQILGASPRIYMRGLREDLL
ncbi:MAG: helix-turn-helix transcriptional regulator [Anaerolineaceae bacterium]|nr:helix-turn-helix transcriptional regulator [Anaerolineaceae bacterium]